MKLRKLMEVVDDEGNLLTKTDDLKAGGELETQASNTTDYNATISHQPFRYDMLGRFGFTLFPFFEGDEKNEKQQELLDEINNLLLNNYIQTLEYFYKNPKKIKQEYRELSDEDFDTNIISDDIKEKYQNLTKEILEKIQPYIEKELEGVQQKLDEVNLDENNIIEDNIMKEKTKKWLDKKEKDKGVLGKENIKKLADLLNNKLDGNGLKTLSELLETKK